MTNSVIIRMQDGKEYNLAGRKDQIAQSVNAARGSGQLIALERDRIPTGQMIWIDPNEVTSVRQDYAY